MLCVAGSGCAWLPKAGPSRDDIQAAARSDAVGNVKFALIDLDLRVVSVLERANETSFEGTFGSRKSSVPNRINRGDQIQIVLWESSAGGLFSPSTSSIAGGPPTGSRSVIIPEQSVGEDGAVTVPYADAGTKPPNNRIRVEGMTPRQVEAAIVARLQGRAVEPQALVTVTKNVSNTVTVLGEVTQGARVPLSTRGDRILDVVASAGGTRAPAHEIFLTLMRDGQAVRIPMQAILRDPKENIPVAPGDVITVAREPQTFTAIGATGTNNVISFDALGLSLEQAIGKAGGLNDQRADPEGVFLIRFEQAELYDQLGFKRPSVDEKGDVPVIYRLNMRDASAFFLARRFPMHNKDILFVSNAPAAEIGKVGTIISTFLVPAGTIIAVGALTK
jgi:polysaccharide export outer membrane protein